MKFEIESAKELYGDKHANVLPDSVNIEFSNFRIHFNFYPITVWATGFGKLINKRSLSLFNPWFDTVIVNDNYDESTQV